MAELSDAVITPPQKNFRTRKQRHRLGAGESRFRKNAFARKFGIVDVSPSQRFRCRAAMAGISGPMAEKLSTVSVDNIGEKLDKSASLLSLLGML